MFFESGIQDGSQCDTRLSESTAALNRGSTKEAFELADKLMNGGKDFSDLDWIYYADVSRMCGLFRRSDAGAVFGLKHNSHSKMLRLITGWDLAASGKFFKAKEIIDSLKGDVPPKHIALLSAIESLNFAMVDWSTSADKAHQQALEEADDDALTWYVLSRASSRRTLWDRAITEGYKAIEHAPQWPRARSALIDSLLSQGRIDETHTIISESKNYPLRDIRMDFIIAMQQEATGQTDAQIETFQQMIEAWPVRAPLSKYAVRQMALTLMTKGRTDEAREVLDRFKVKEFLKQDTTAGQGKHKFISIPLVSQTYNHCVPTVAAMVATAQGVDADRKKYADDMYCRDGTPLWRMVDYMTSLGFEACPVRPAIDVIEGMIDQGVPLIGTLQGLMNAHVEVVCGYDQALQMLHIRDPMHWHTVGTLYDAAEKRWAESPGLWAFISPENRGKVEIQIDWISNEGQAMIDLMRACAKGERATAEDSYKRIDDKSPLAFMRDGVARGVAITPAEYASRLQGYSVDEESPFLQMRSLLRLADRNNKDKVLALAKDNQDKFGKFFYDFVKATCEMACYQWEEAHQTLLKLTKKWPGIDQFWGQLAMVQIELGKRNEAKASLNRAIEISPQTDWLQNRSLRQAIGDVPYQERLSQIDELIREFPDSTQSKMTRAEILREGPDGMAYEKAAREAIRLFPREPFAYQLLSDWYLSQERTDLARKILQNGRILVGTDELPELPFETLPDSECISPSVNPSTTETNDQEGGGDKLSLAKKKVDTQTNDSRFDRDPEQILKEECQRKLVEKIDDCGYREFEDLEEVKLLLRLERDGHLFWWEAGLLLAMRIHCLVTDSTEEFHDQEYKDVQLRRLLGYRKGVPAGEFPGVPEAFVGTVFSRNDPANMHRSAVQIMLEWTEHHCKDIESFPALQLDVATFTEHAGLLNEAESQLQSLVKNHPAYQPALFRMGQIALSRQDLASAKTYFEKCLSVAPGDIDSMWQLLTIARSENPAQLQSWQEKLVTLMPYSLRYTHQAANAIAQNSNLQQGLGYLDSRKDFLHDGRLPLLKADLHNACQDPFTAMQILYAEDLPTKFPYSAKWTEVEARLPQSHIREAADLLREMNREWPDDMNVIMTLNDALSRIDPVESKNFAKQCLQRGKAAPALANACFDGDPMPDQTARGIISSAPADRKLLTAVVCCESIFADSPLNVVLNFVNWCKDQFPKERVFRSRLATVHDMMGNSAQAIQIADELYNESPNDPRSLVLLGQVSIPTQPNRAVEYLQKAYDLTGESNTLCDIGRAQLKMRQMEPARATFMAVLQKNRINCTALSSLMAVYEDYSPQILQMTMEAIDAGLGYDQALFLVQAIEVCKLHKQIMNPNWIYSALRRYEIVRLDGGVADEEAKLKLAIYAWMSKWGEKEMTREFGTWTDWFKVRFSWPGLGWIPPKQ